MYVIYVGSKLPLVTNLYSAKMMNRDSCNAGDKSFTRLRRKFLEPKALYSCALLELEGGGGRQLLSVFSNSTPGIGRGKSCD